MPLLKATNKEIGKLGEILPSNDLFEEVIDLNAIKHNFPVFDTIVKMDGAYYALSIKARKKYQKNGSLNSQYNILTGSGKRVRKFKKALDLLEDNGYDIATMKFGFVVAPLKQGEECIYYMGLLSEVNEKFTVDNCLSDTCGNIYVPVKESDLMKYRQIGKHSWDFIENHLKSA
jgi:hypothetical protein